MTFLFAEPSAHYLRRGVQAWSQLQTQLRQKQPPEGWGPLNKGCERRTRALPDAFRHRPSGRNVVLRTTT
jgi:hypothetical protein